MVGHYVVLVMEIWVGLEAAAAAAVLLVVAAALSLEVAL